MSLVFKKGNIFHSECEAIVNPINCVGAMGKGLAKKYKDLFPENFKKYKEMCGTKLIKPGFLLICEEYSKELKSHKKVINFPTKKHWKYPSKMSYIEDGLDELLNAIIAFEISSIAIPALGCGLGGLAWDDVKKLISDKLGNVSIYIEVYEPN